MSTRLILATLIAAWLGACSDEAPSLKAPPVRVEGEIVTLVNAENAGFLKLATVVADTGGELRLPGRLIWDETRTVRVFPQLGGRVSGIAVDVGNAVKSGQTLAVLQSADYGLAQSDARRAAADWRVAEQARERSRVLREAGVVAEKDWQQAEAEAVRAQAEAARTSRRLAGLGGDGDGSYVLKAPLAGTVVERNINPGMEYRAEQAGAPMFVITDPTALWFQLDAGEGDVAALKPGEPIHFSVKQYPGEIFKGRITRVADFVDPQSRTIRVRGEVGNADRRLKGEMFIEARVELPPSQALHVPAGAIFLQGDTRYAFVEEAVGRYRRQKVDAGNEHEGWLDVWSGLKAGDKVVIEGNLHLLKYFKPQAGKGK